LIEIDADAYERDPCKVPSLSASVAKILVSLSPAHAYAAHPKLGGVYTPVDPVGPQARGIILHKLLLGRGTTLVSCPFDDWRTNAAKDMRDGALKQRKIPVLASKLEGLEKVAERILDSLRGCGYEFTGLSEATITWEDKAASGEVVHCRARLDHLLLADGHILDLKSAADASPRAVGRRVVDMGSDIQQTAYKRALEALRPELVGRSKFTFLFFETEPPFAVVPIELDGQFEEIGRMRWEQALEVWARCLKSGRWPAYSNGETVTVSPPPWILNEHIGTWRE
jgi:hypothetical protein